MLVPDGKLRWCCELASERLQWCRPNMASGAALFLAPPMAGRSKAHLQLHRTIHRKPTRAQVPPENAKLRGGHAREQQIERGKAAVHLRQSRMENRRRSCIARYCILALRIDTAHRHVNRPRLEVVASRARDPAEAAT